MRLLLVFLQEVDAALLSVIGFPAFAVENPELIKLTRDTIESKLRVSSVLNVVFFYFLLQIPANYLIKV